MARTSNIFSNYKMNAVQVGKDTTAPARVKEKQGYPCKCNDCLYEWKSPKPEGPRQCPRCKQEKWRNPGAGKMRVKVTVKPALKFRSQF